MNLKKMILCSLSSFLICGCAGNLKIGPKENLEIVEAEGVFAGTPYNPVEAKSAALFNARRNSVERVMDLFLSDELKVRRQSLLESKILNAPHAYIKKYKIVSESEGAGEYKTKIKAYIFVDKIMNSLRSSKLIQGPALSFKNCLAVKETIDGTASKSGKTLQGFESVFNGEKSFEWTRLSGEDMPEGDLIRAAAVSGCRIALIGVSSAEKIAVSGQIQTGFVQYRSKFTVKVFDIPTGKVSDEIFLEANSMDASAENSAQKALYSAGEAVAREISPRMSKLINVETPMKLVVKSIKGAEKIRNFKNFLESLPVVQAVSLENLEFGEAVFHVYAGRIQPEEFVSHILRKEILPLELEGTGKNEIVLKVVQ
ncbi:MAG: hypothetical protein HY746_07255 [Elusimicrobia bacterium]|nr:hypothetical protein [Elusimicrobiota bacterium]